MRCGTYAPLLDRPGILRMNLNFGQNIVLAAKPAPLAIAWYGRMIDAPPSLTTALESPYGPLLLGPASSEKTRYRLCNYSNLQSSHTLQSHPLQEGASADCQQRLGRHISVLAPLGSWQMVWLSSTAVCGPARRWRRLNLASDPVNAVDSPS